MIIILKKKKKFDCRDKQMIELQVSFFEKSFSMQVLNDCYDSSYDANGSLLLTCKNCDAQLRGDAKCHIVSGNLWGHTCSKNCAGSKEVVRKKHKSDLLVKVGGYLDPCFNIFDIDTGDLIEVCCVVCRDACIQKVRYGQICYSFSATASNIAFNLSEHLKSNSTSRFTFRGKR